MPKFHYKAKKMTGEEIKGVQEAQDRFELARNLRQEGYILISSEIEKDKKELAVFSYFLGIVWRVSTAEKMIFCRNLAVMMAAGLPISRALNALGRQTRNKRFQKVILSLVDGIQKGRSLSEVMSEHPAIFSTLFIAMIKAGEKSGKLNESLNLLAKQMEATLILKKRVLGALIYPAIIVAAMIGIGILMLIFVVPTLVGVFEELNVQLPFSTQIVISASKFLSQRGLLATAGLLVIIGLIFWLSRTKPGKTLIDMVVLRFPYFSTLVKKINSSRTTRTLSSLISAGVEITEAFEVTKDVLQNHYYKEVMEKAKSEIQKGSAISKTFIEAEKLYPPLVGEMISVGEETGQLPNMLLQLANFYEEEVAEATKNLATIIEPILMIVIGAVVGFFALAMIRPMYSMMGGL
jgi:type IV pilus assembly protein PilC